MDAARDVFYRLYRSRERSDLVDGVLKQLEFHPLSVTLLATVAQQNRWSVERLIKEWEGRRTDTLRTEHQTSLGATIELSLTSPMFKELGPDARGLVGVVAFYPQGVDEDNINWLFPTVPNGTHIFDRFCILSLTYRSNGFITMLAPLRDHLCPKDPMSSSLLCTTKERYFDRMSVILSPNRPGFGDSRWIISEDVNVEHLLNVFTSIDPDSADTWEAFINFMYHMGWHKPRATVLKKRIEELPDDHSYKPRCLLELGALYGMTGNHALQASLLNRTLKLERERGNITQVALTLRELSKTSEFLHHYKEGMDQAMEALEIFGLLGEREECAGCLNTLALFFKGVGQLDAAEAATLSSIKLLPEEGQEQQFYMHHLTLGEIYRAKGERRKAIQQYELALGTAPSFDWDPSLYAIHMYLVALFLDEDKLDKAQVHVEQAKPLALENPVLLGSAVHLQSVIWFRQRRFEEAVSEALHAQEIFEKLGHLEYLERTRVHFRELEKAMKSLPPSGELPETIVSLALFNSPFSAQGAPSSASTSTSRDPDHQSG